MRHCLRIVVATIVFASLSSAEKSDSFCVWLQLPQKPDFGLTKRIQSTDAFVLRLLSEDATKQNREPVGDQGPVVRYEAKGWSSHMTADERQLALRQLSQTWGSALHIDGAPAQGSVMLAQNKAQQEALAHAAAAESLLAPALPAQTQNLFYDGSRRSPEAGNPGAVFASFSGAPAVAVPNAKVPLKTVIPLIEKAPPLAPAWTTPYADVILKAARDSGVDPELLRAVVAAKSKYRAKLQSGGAFGLMGISAANAKLYGYTPNDMLDPEKNVSVGVDILAGLLKQFGGDVSRALAAYQVGAYSVLKSGGLPNDKNVQEFLGSVALAQDPASRLARLPVGTIRSPLKFEAQKDLVELAQQGRNRPGVARWRPLIDKAAAAVDVDARLMEAMIMQEDPSGDPTSVSPKGAVGLTQLMPDTAKQYGVKDSTDPRQNLHGGARYLKYLLKMFDNNMVLAVASYNAGEGTVSRLGRVPRYNETMAYVRRVFDNYFTLTGTRVDIEPHMPPPLPPRLAKTAPRAKEPAIVANQ